MVDRIAHAYDAQLKVHVRGKLIDLGCGKIPLYEAYKDYVTDHVCVDWANSAHMNEHLDYECDLTKGLPFDEEAFDTIILSDVLEHIPEPDLLWLEIARILAPRGKIIMNVPFFYWIHEHPYDYYRYTEYALRRFVDRVGMRVVLLKPIGGAPEILTDIFAKALVRLPFVGKLSCTCLQALMTGLLATRIGKKISQITEKDFPLAYIMVAEKVY